MDFRKIVEVSEVTFIEESNETTYKESRYNLFPDGDIQVLDFSLGAVVVSHPDGTVINGDLSVDEVISYVQGRKDADIEVVYADKQTTHDQKGTIIPSPTPAPTVGVDLAKGDDETVVSSVEAPVAPTAEELDKTIDELVKE